MIGTVLNVSTILLGGCVGLLLGKRLPEAMRQTVTGGLGLVVALLGLQMALTTRNIIIVMFSVLLGGVLGEWMELEQRLNRLGDWLQSRLTGQGSDHGRVSEGFVTASLVFCVGPMALIGPIQDGLLGEYRLLAIKSLLDGFAAMAFSAALGWGVLLSAGSILLYQGGISVVAMLLAGIAMGGIDASLPEVVELTATGGVLTVAIGLKLLDIKPLRVANYLPALALAPAIAWAVQALATLRAG